MNIWRAVPALSAAVLALAGCVSIPDDRGAQVVETLVGGDSKTPLPSLGRDDPDGVTALNQKFATAVVGADEAVQLALLNNPLMRQLYAELGLAQAEVYDASRLSNPALGYMQLSAAGGGGTQKTWSLTQNFTELLFIGYRTRVGKAALRQAQQQVAHEVTRLEADVRIAYYRYVGATQAAQSRQSVAAAASLAAELAERFYAAGNISALQASREQAAAAAAIIAQRQAQTLATTARGELFTAIGLQVNRASLEFSAELPLPVALTATVEELQEQALRQRLDLQAMRIALGMRSDQLSHTRGWRWLGGVTLAAERETGVDGELLRGGGASVELPVFNSGRGSVLRARSSQEAAAATLAAQELRIANEIAVQYAAVEAARMTVEDYRQRLVPLRERIVGLSQQQQNYLLIGAFDVLAAKREEIEAQESHIDAVRDYWIAHTRLAGEIGGVK